jgi:hypothetical protein
MASELVEIEKAHRPRIDCTCCYDGITGVTGILERYIFPTRQKKTHIVIIPSPSFHYVADVFDAFKTHMF